MQVSAVLLLVSGRRSNLLRISGERGPAEKDIEERSERSDGSAKADKIGDVWKYFWGRDGETNSMKDEPG